MLGVLTTIKKQANKSILLENSNTPTLQDQMSGVKVHLPHKKVLWDTSLSFFPASEVSKEKLFLPTLQDKEEMTCLFSISEQVSELPRAWKEAKLVEIDFLWCFCRKVHADIAPDSFIKLPLHLPQFVI